MSAKVAVVVGAGALGRATAMTLAARGLTVVAVGVRRLGRTWFWRSADETGHVYPGAGRAVSRSGSWRGRLGNP
jgi:NAD(P)-dependent dehydrogenase (short-subunit alcohol dehydrogenase family)